MCVIVTSQADTMPSLTQLARMSDANPDGAGIAWHDGQRLHRYRNEDNMKTLAFIMDHWQSLETSPFLLHFRLATHGKVCTGNTHPFRFRKGDRTGFIAHNGIARVVRSYFFDMTNEEYAAFGIKNCEFVEYTFDE